MTDFISPDPTWSGDDADLPLLERRPLDCCDESAMLQLQSEWGMTTRFHLDEAGTGMNTLVLRSDLTVADAVQLTHRRLQGLCGLLGTIAELSDEDEWSTPMLHTACEELRLVMGTHGMTTRALEHDRALRAAEDAAGDADRPAAGELCFST